MSLTIRAPELPSDFTWLNTPRALSMRELRGHVVVLDFWTYCCVNCMHVLPVLRAIEERHAHDPLVVIGVHSAKFDGEKDPERIADAIARYGIKHPVIVDREMRIWNDFAIRSWPTLVVVRPDGTIAAVAPGEPDPAVLEAFLTTELDRAREKGQLVKQAVRIDEVAPASRGQLAYPGKIDVAEDGRIVVSDSGRHRIVLLDKHGEVLETIGCGVPGFRDGSFEECELDDPQGVRFDASGTAIFIADARNHTIARADLASRTLTTIAGNGRLGHDPLSASKGEVDATSVALRSPWDIVLAPGRREGDSGDRLYVALAGSHQIALLDLGTGKLSHVAGTSAESMVDGDFSVATFSQPSGLALSGSELYVADSETSSVRVLDLERRTVRTLVGVGLFDFGDVDGTPDRARLQHDVGIALGADRAPVVADTYNHKLKRVDAATGETRTIFFGADGLVLREPGGLVWDASRKAYLVADTGHGRILEISEDGGKARVLTLSELPQPKKGVARPRFSLHPPSVPTHWFNVPLEEQGALAEGEAELRVTLRLQQGLHLALRSTVTLSVEVSRRSDLLVARSAKTKGDIDALDRPVTLAVAFTVNALPEASIASEVLVFVECIACTDGNDGNPAACIPLRAHVRIPVRLAREGTHHLDLEIPIADAD